MKPRVEIGRPVIYTPRQIAVLLGPALQAYEAEQSAAHTRYDASTHRRPPSVVPLRGIVMVGLYTLMRPSNNLSLTWEEIVLHDVEDRGSFHLVRHKNAKKGFSPKARFTRNSCGT